MNSGEPWSKSWKIVSPLGGGGQGDTFIVAKNGDSSLTGVLKCLRAGKEADPKARRRMFQEVSNLKVLHGAGAKVPKVFEDNTAKFSSADPLFIVMELIDGNTLSAVVEKNVLEIKTAIAVALQLCDTLRYAVKERIVHRDIKPENIIVRSLSPADVVMVDFGVARSEADSSNVTEVGETFDNRFISLPERRGPEENKRDPRSDLTGVCAILLYCLTKCVPRDLRDSSGRPPHRWNNSTLDKVIPDLVQRTLLNAFFDRGFSWELDARFQTVDEIASRLAEVLSPTASIPHEDISVVAARESALLRKSDRVTQLAIFGQPIRELAQQWNKQIDRLAEKISSSRFHLSKGDTELALADSQFGDFLYAYFLRVGVQNHPIYRVIGYHFCSIGEECSIIRKIDRIVFRDGNWTSERIEDPATITRYSGSGETPFELLITDTESSVSRMMSHLRAEIDQKSAAKI